ncbi:molybdopterin-dependent oxidoreductase [Limisalsivibrio acetivorans]|uniref:molybdopterin-dependent oxidoreductase n=1 Tax=Limisalsivibrio acetivorans TaxID=1304888 RepID=UPI0003B47D7A|nr:molybdopterin-dependent oxidoreductase [Limisalsivibrio acetivorans]
MNRFFCSKDCPDLCEFTVEHSGSGMVFSPAEKEEGRNGFVCRKLKGFYEREVENGAPFDEEGIEKAGDLIRKNMGKPFLYIRGSGSLAYNMGYWDQLFSRIPGAVFVEGGPCDETAIAAQERDFGVCANPPVENLEGAETIISFGKNARVTSPHLYGYMKELKQKGCRIAYIDPVKSESRRLADLYIQNTPGTDGLLAAALLMHRNGEEGWEELIDEADVNRSDFLKLSGMLRDGKTGIIIGWGLQRYSNGFNANRWINRLAVKTANVGRLYFGRSSKSGMVTPAAEETGTINIGRLPVALAEGEFPLAVIVAANPAMTYPDSNMWDKGLKKTTLISVDTNLNETTTHADAFIRVGGMFAQPDMMGSYFFPKEARRDVKVFDVLSDQEAASKLARLLDIELDIKPIDEVERFQIPPREYREEKLDLLRPSEGEGFRLITSSHMAWLNSQVPPSLGENVSHIYISEETAAETSFGDGDIIEAYNSTGSFTGVCRISDMVRGRDILVYKNRTMKEGRPNAAIPAGLTDSKNAYNYYDAFVSLRRKE